MRTLKRAKIVPSTKQNTKFKPTLETLISIFNNKIKNTSKKGHLIAYRKAKMGVGPYTKILIPDNLIKDEIKKIVKKIIKKYEDNTKRNIHQTPHLLKNIEKNSPNLYNSILNGIRKSNPSVHKNLLNKLYRNKFLQFGIDINLKEDKDKLKTLIDKQSDLNKALERVLERLRSKSIDINNIQKDDLDKLKEYVAHIWIWNLNQARVNRGRPLKDPFNDVTIKAKFVKLIGHINSINSSNNLKYELNFGKNSRGSPMSSLDGFFRKLLKELNIFDNLSMKNLSWKNEKTKRSTLAKYLSEEAKKRKSNK